MYYLMLRNLALYLCICTAIAAAGIVLNWRRPRVVSVFAGLASLLITIFLAALPLGDGTSGKFFLDARFASVYLATFGLFGVLPISMALWGWSFFAHGRWRWACLFWSATCATWAVAVDAWFIEPQWLEVSHFRLQSEKLKEPLRIAVLADFQTDNIGAYEERVLRAAQAENPDLILFAGDYIQCPGWKQYTEQKDKFQALLKRAPLNAKYGVFAVGGNVDAFQISESGYEALWVKLFEGSSIKAEDPTVLHDLGAFWLTALNVWESSSVVQAVRAAPDSRFHIALGHLPNIVLAQIKKGRTTPADVDLIIAGHVHGGQIRLPLLGPITTNSAISRKWATGINEYAPGKFLLVSRGIGLERGWAPRIRFLCRPELCILDIVPTKSERGGDGSDAESPTQSAR